MLVPIPIACFIGTLATDIAYACTAEMMWANFSAWLLVVGMIFGVLAGIARLDRFSRQPPDTRTTAGMATHAGQYVVLLLALLNTFVHTRDAWTSVVPFGLILSVIVVLILPVTGWLGWSLVYRYGVGGVRGAGAGR